MMFIDVDLQMGLRAKRAAQRGSIVNTKWSVHCSTPAERFSDAGVHAEDLSNAELVLSKCLRSLSAPLEQVLTQH